MADTVRGTIYPNLPGNCPDAGYKLVSKQGFVEPPLSSENLEWVKDEAITDADKDQIYENKHDIETLSEEVSNIDSSLDTMQDAIDEKSTVSGETYDGTNWSAITINGVKKNIPSGGGGGGFTPTQDQLDAMNSGIDSTKVAQIETNADDIDNINDTIADIQSDLADKQDQLTPGDGIIITGTNIEANVGDGLELATQQGSVNKAIKVKVDGTSVQFDSNGALKAVGSTPADAYTKSETDALLNNKVDKVTGKGLSTNDYTNADKTKLDGIDMSTKQDVLSTAQLNAVNSGIDSTKVAQIATNTTNIANKVDKETGKGLSTNDYTTAEKNKVALINSTETLTFTLSGGTTVNLKVVTGV